jgi:hypothetical protein
MAKKSTPKTATLTTESGTVVQMVYLPGLRKGTPNEWWIARGHSGKMSRADCEWVEAQSQRTLRELLGT